MVSQESMQLQPGDSIGEYIIREVIGNGGFSVVYRAEDRHLLRPVAIKQLQPEAFTDDDARESFIREARLAASLNHPNIVATYALREAGDALFLIMEYLDGGDLHSLIADSGPLDRRLFLTVASDICHALQTLHARRVLHRDVKPENILITGEGHFKLADFGLAHVAQAYAQDSAFGPQPGTLLYMSPEQALGEEVTPRSDIYSLAVVLYEAMTGHYYLPYDADAPDDDALRDLIAGEAPLLPQQRHPSIPAALGDVLLRALEKDPARRPASASEFLSEIKSTFARGKASPPAPTRRAAASPAPRAASALLRELYAVRTLRDAEHQPQAALERLRPTVELYPNVPEVAAEWGETLVALGQLDEGRAWLERAVRRSPALPFAWLTLADLARDTDEDAASAALVAAIRADPDLAYAVLYEEISGALTDPAAYAGWVEIFRHAAAEVPGAPLLHNLGQVLALSPAHRADSQAAFHAAIDADPDYGPAYVGLGSLLIEMGRLADAVALLEQATYLVYPAIPEGDWHKTHTVYQRPHAFLALAVAYAQTGQIEHSAVAARTVFELDPAELEEDAPELLDTYWQAAQRWRAGGDPRRAYHLLTGLIPLAAYWGHVALFALLHETGQAIPPAERLSHQWDEARHWLKLSLLRLRRPGG